MDLTGKNKARMHWPLRDIHIVRSRWQRPPHHTYGSVMGSFEVSDEYSLAMVRICFMFILIDA